jgi:hypothetical protein
VKLKDEKISLEKTRFDLEQAITQLWSSSEDVRLIFEQFYEYHEDRTIDELAHALLGVEQLIKMRGQQVFDIFEVMVKNGKIN